MCKLSIEEIKCTELDESQWFDSLPLTWLMPKLRTYVEYDKYFQIEPYVEYFLKEMRKISLMDHITIGILLLHFETGMFINVKLEDRICQMCKTNDIEIILN